jgi:hypothetical protein
MRGSTRVFGLAVVALLACTLAAAAEDKFQGCSDDDQISLFPSYSSAPAPALFALMKGWRFVHCNRDDIAALSTVAVAIFTAVLGAFTISLALSTKRAADAAKQSSDAALAIELPLIRVWAPMLLNMDQPIPASGPYAGADVTLLPGEFSTVSEFSIINHGRTNAIVDRLMVGWDFSLELPRTPRYRSIRDYPNGEVLTQRSRQLEPERFTIECPKAIEEALINKTKAFRFFVSVIYSDFMGQRHHANFCWQWGCPEGVGNHHFFVDDDVPAAYISKG